MRYDLIMAEDNPIKEYAATQLSLFVIIIFPSILIILGIALMIIVKLYLWGFVLIIIGILVGLPFYLNLNRVRGYLYNDRFVLESKDSYQEVIFDEVKSIEGYDQKISLGSPVGINQFRVNYKDGSSEVFVIENFGLKEGQEIILRIEANIK